MLKKLPQAKQRLENNSSSLPENRSSKCEHPVSEQWFFTDFALFIL